MAKINILPASVYNRIAAGEVVERPYSVVKELVENSIDAGATEIEIHIEQGGKQLVRVIDNGCGIDREDLHSAFLPHATSKIAQAEDLDKIFTLGFRGEAVASIASVSKMTITSKTENGKCYSLHSDGGKLGQITEAAGENGTDVRVEMLFFNTPVRLNFLKGDKAEETDITTFVSRFILSRPDVAFTYYVDGRKVLQSFGSGEEEAFLSVYGADVLSKCYKIDVVKHGIRIRGYIGNQNFFKANKSYQSVFLNGRYIRNDTVATAMIGAYSSYLMKRQHPFYVLYLQMPSEIVDVNVHPNKLDVRFAENRMVYSTIYSVIAAVLDGQSKALDYVVKDDKTFDSTLLQAEAYKQEEVVQQSIMPSIAQSEEQIASQVEEQTVPQKTLSETILERKDEEEDSQVGYLKNPTFGFAPFTYEDAKKEIEESNAAFKSKKPERKPGERLKGFTPREEIGPYTGELQRMSAFEEKRPPIPDKKEPEKLVKMFPGLRFKRMYIEFNDPAYEKAKKEGRVVDHFEENKRYLEEMDAKAKQNRIDVSACKYAGKLFNTYVLYERDNEVYIIDQHAAHERLIFNRLKERMQNRDIATQSMLFPYEIKLNAFEGAFIRERMDDIRAMGFDVVEDGENVFKVHAVPVDLQNIQLNKFFNDILSEVNTYRAIKLEEILKDKLASAACKAAVKGGMDLTQEEIDALFVLMDGDMGLKCPHGRPVVVKMTKTQLEKMFKRIV